MSAGLDLVYVYWARELRMQVDVEQSLLDALDDALAEDLTPTGPRRPQGAPAPRRRARPVNPETWGRTAAARADLDRSAGVVPEVTD